MNPIFSKVTLDLPEFPRFESLQLGHKKKLEGFLKSFPPYSDHNFSGLFAWDIRTKVAVCELNGNFVMRSADYLTGEIFISFLGVNKIRNTVDQIIEYCETTGLNPALHLIPQTVIELVPDGFEKTYEIQEDRAHFDYILSVEELAHFRKAKYATKRRLYNQFLREHKADIYSRELNLDSEQDIRQLFGVAEEWRNAKTAVSNKEDIDKEMQSLKVCISHASELGAKAFGVYKQDLLVAFCIFEILPHRFAIGHYIKAISSYKGIFEYLMSESARYLLKQGVEYLNIEQDLGIEGLRQNKMGYRPVKFLRKYTISKKQV